MKVKKGTCAADHGRPAHDAESLAVYMDEINRIPLLTGEEEQTLARTYRTGMTEGSAFKALDAAHALVTGNLRFVVKVAFEYRAYGFRMVDLIQEGNIGLMKAVQKFDPDHRRIRFISYGVWWIRAYMQNYILRNWSLVDFGTAKARHKLLLSLARIRRNLETAGVSASDETLGNKTRPSEVTEHLEGRDLSLDAPMGDIDDFMNKLDSSLRARMNSRLQKALATLDVRERFVIEQRLLAEKPMTLRQLGEHFGFSRERVRQLEIDAKEQLREELAGLAALINAD